MAVVLGIVVLMLFALIGLLHTLDRMDRRRPGDLRGAEVVPMRPRGSSAPVYDMQPGKDGVFRAS